MQGLSLQGQVRRESRRRALKEFLPMAEKKTDKDAVIKKAISDMEKGKMSREERLSKMCETINKGEFGGERKDAVTWLGSRQSQSIERFSSGDQDINDALGGGWPKGRFIEIYGPESGGKSTLCLHAIAEFQRKYPEDDVALIDTEYSFDEDYAIALGVNTKYLLVHQPDDGNQALNVLEQLIKLGVGLIVVDSVAALTSKNEMEGNLGDDQVAEQARLMSRSLRRLTAEAGKRRVTVFWTNQMREKIGINYGDKTTTPAGRALKHYASIRCGVRRVATETETIDGQKVAIASQTRLDVKKNKTAPPFRSADFFITYGRGIDPVVSMFDAAIKRGVVKKKGAWFSYGEDNLAQGRYNALQELYSDEDLFKRIKDDVETAIVQKRPVTEKKAIKKPSASKKDDEIIDVDIIDVEVEDA